MVGPYNFPHLNWPGGAWEHPIMPSSPLIAVAYFTTTTSTTIVRLCDATLPIWAIVSQRLQCTNTLHTFEFELTKQIQNQICFM